MLRPAIEESLEVRDCCPDIQHLRIIIIRPLLNAGARHKHTKAMAMKKSSDPIDLVRILRE